MTPTPRGRSWTSSRTGRLVGDSLCFLRGRCAVSGTGTPGSGIYRGTLARPERRGGGTLLPFRSGLSTRAATLRRRTSASAAQRARRVYEPQVAVLPADALLIAGGAGWSGLSPRRNRSQSLPAERGRPRSSPRCTSYSGGLLTGGVMTQHPSIRPPRDHVVRLVRSLQPARALGDGHVRPLTRRRVDMRREGLLGRHRRRSMLLPGQTAPPIYRWLARRLRHSGLARRRLRTIRPHPPARSTTRIRDPAVPARRRLRHRVLSVRPCPAERAASCGCLSLVQRSHFAGDVRRGRRGRTWPSARGRRGRAIRIVAAVRRGGSPLGLRRARTNRTTRAGGGGRIGVVVRRTTRGRRCPGPGRLRRRQRTHERRDASPAARRGTIYLGTDALWVPKAPGRARRHDGSGKPAWPTPVSGAQRLRRRRGAWRRAARSSTGPQRRHVDPPAVNDIASLTLDAEARAELSASCPQVTLTTVPRRRRHSISSKISVTTTHSSFGLQRIDRVFSPASPIVSGSTTSPTSARRVASHFCWMSRHDTCGADHPHPRRNRPWRETTQVVSDLERFWTNHPPTGTLIVSRAARQHRLARQALNLHRARGGYGGAVTGGCTRHRSGKRLRPGRSRFPGSLRTPASPDSGHECTAASTVTVWLDVLDSAGSASDAGTFAVTFLRTRCRRTVSNPRRRRGKLQPRSAGHDRRGRERRRGRPRRSISP